MYGWLINGICVHICMYVFCMSLSVSLCVHAHVCKCRCQHALVHLHHSKDNKHLLWNKLSRLLLVTVAKLPNNCPFSPSSSLLECWDCRPAVAPRLVPHELWWSEAMFSGLRSKHVNQRAIFSAPRYVLLRSHCGARAFPTLVPVSLAWGL